MKNNPRLSRILVVTGLVAILAGTLDPLEGSVVILAGCAALAAGAWIGHSPHRTLAFVAFALVLIGVAALFGLSAIGGIGGNSGRSLAWGLTLVPYPIGWIVALIGAWRILRERDVI
jgi:hypothetical protein